MTYCEIAESPAREFVERYWKSPDRCFCGPLVWMLGVHFQALGAGRVVGMPMPEPPAASSNWPIWFRRWPATLRNSPVKHRPCFSPELMWRHCLRNPDVDFSKTAANGVRYSASRSVNMKTKVAAIGILSAIWLWGQTQSTAVIVSGSDAKWSHDAGDPPDTEAVVLRMDKTNGSMELLVRFPGGHVFKPHWHEANERIIVLEGRLAIGQGDQQVQVDSGGYAFLPAREVQYLTCSSKTRCTMYLGWDGNFASHNLPVAK